MGGTFTERQHLTADTSDAATANSDTDSESQRSTSMVTMILTLRMPAGAAPRCCWRTVCVSGPARETC